MNDVARNVIEKISSYNLFNNFFPGIIFCYMVKEFTRFSLADGELLENLFIYYFVGMIISRVGSMFVEKILKLIKVKNKKTNTKEAFLNFAPYNEYIEASENSPFIKTLNEVNNVYRTIIAVFIAIIVVKLYDWLFYDFINNIGVLGNNLIFIIICLLIVLLFSQSYKKQTDYIRSRVEEYTNSKQIQ